MRFYCKECMDILYCGRMTPHVEMHDSTRFYSECGGKTACGFTAIWRDVMIACCKSLGVHYQINFTIAYEN